MKMAKAPIIDKAMRRYLGRGDACMSTMIKETSPNLEGYCQIVLQTPLQALVVTYCLTVLKIAGDSGEIVALRHRPALKSLSRLPAGRR
jgi:hypothetical protein